MLNLRQASMRNVWIIAHREYMERIRTRGFLITTVMIPMIIAAFAFGSTFLASRANQDLRIAVISTDGRLAHDLQEELEGQAKSAVSGDETSMGRGIGTSKPLNISVIAVEPGTDAEHRLEGQLDSGELDGYLRVAPATGTGARPA